jgi:predicted site-specific integrase-resolvase
MVYEALCVRPKEAAKMLGISERTLWELTAPRGRIPCIKLGKGKRAPVLYPVEALKRWIAESQRQVQGGRGDE